MIVCTPRAKSCLKTPSNTLNFAHSFINFCSDCPNLSSSFVEFANGDPCFHFKNQDSLFLYFYCRRNCFFITCYTQRTNVIFHRNTDQFLKISKTPPNFIVELSHRELSYSGFRTDAQNCPIFIIASLSLSTEPSCPAKAFISSSSSASAGFSP